jgi:hypothetical protein
MRKSIYYQIVWYFNLITFLFVSTINFVQASSKWDSADVIADIEVLAVTLVRSCDAGKKSSCVYHSWLCVTDAQKGNIPRTILVEWNAQSNSVCFLPGDSFRAFLKWDVESKIYRAEWVASEKELKKLVNAKLPSKTGVIIIKEHSLQQ